MEDTARSFLLDIISQVNPAKARGPNYYEIEIKHEIFNDCILFKGSKHYVWCYQIGQNIELDCPSAWASDSHFNKVNLADPSAGYKILMVLTEADH